MAYYDKTLNEVVNDIITNIHDALPEADTKSGTFIRNVFVNPVSDEITAMYGDMKLLKLGQSVLTAVGDDLDYLAGNYFISRKPATKSSGKVRFYIKNSNKSVSNIKDTDIPDSVTIAYGTVVSTVGDYTTTAVSFQTTETAYYTRDQIKELAIDGDTGYRYIEVAAESVGTGSAANVSADTITVLETANTAVYFISNPYGFSGGTDAESDADLARRVELVLTGSNIGTKDGYLAYTLAQDNVIDAKVVGAGDNIMFRDGGYIDLNGNYQYGLGGMVDIYVRGHQNVETTYNFTLSSDYIRNEGAAFSNIILPKQPVSEIISITSQTTGTTLINAASFEIEKSTVKDTTDSTKSSVKTKYCKDILWDFSITDTFPDTDYYSIPAGLTATQIKDLKTKLDKELTDALAYMSDMIYSIDWSTVTEKTSEGGSTTLFTKIYYNNGVYKIIAKDNSGLDGRMFIMKNDKIYERVYVQPDYILSKDQTNYAGSVTAIDSIKWLNTSNLVMNDTLLIKYNYDYLIESIQTGMENVRCLTADVLIKQAVEIPIEIIATISCYTYSTLTAIKNEVNTNLSYWIDSLKTLGGEFDKSDIVALIKQTIDVDSVDLDTLQIAVKGYDPQKKISCADNEYFKTANIILNVAYNTTVSA